uniref:glucuronosyltransferase n=1 Tax=Meloidogyne hapla TaxID=6305 RepID=A0A1I8B820_MELHA
MKFILILFLFKNVFGYKILVFSPTTLLEVEFKLPLGSLNITKYAKIKQIGSFTSPIDDEILKDISDLKQIENVKVKKFYKLIIHLLLLNQPIPEHTASVLGLPYPTSYVPALTLSGYSDKMTIFERFYNLFFQIASYLISFEVYDSLTLIMQKHFGPNYPNIRQIVKDSPLILVNADEFVDFPRPLFSNIIYIGGIGMNEIKIKEKYLNKQIENQINNEIKKGKKGFILFSIGTIMRSNELPEIFIKNLFKVFEEFSDYYFIVKTDISDNLIKELARHPNLKLFITHCGYNSLLESATAGIPILAIPFFFDQFRNARVAERNGWGLNFDKRLLLKSSKEFKIAIKTIFENERFKLNAERTKKLIITKPFTGEQRLLESFKFLEQNGGDLKELLPESRNLSTIELYNLDVLFIIVLILVIIFLIIIIIFRKCWKLLKSFIKKEDKIKSEDKIK